MLKHGPITCNKCKSFMNHVDTKNNGVYSYDLMESKDGKLILENNPLSFGSSDPDVLILGFSKGKKQNDKLFKSQSCTNIDIIDDASFRTIAFDGLQEIIEATLKATSVINDSDTLDQLLNSQESSFQFGSAIKCSLHLPAPEKEKFSPKKIMKASTDAEKIINNCIQKHHSDLKDHTLIIHFGGKEYLKSIEHIDIFDDGIKVHGKARYATTGKMTWLFIKHPSHFARSGGLKSAQFRRFIDEEAENYRDLIKDHYQSHIDDLSDIINNKSHESGEGEKFGAKLLFIEDEWRIEIGGAISLGSDENGEPEFDHLYSLEGISCLTPLVAFNMFKSSVNQYLEEL